MLSDEQINHTPAIALPLSGRHLIEASAGTGKTWTLTGVVLRLIVQAGYPCEKIIATTFTKSASADMKQRIRERLQSFYQLLTMVIGHNFQNSLSDFDNTADIATQKLEKLTQFMQEVEQTAIQQGKQAHYDDLVNQYLLQMIASQLLDNNVSLDFQLAKKRTQTALNQLDKLFVNTLDSLCQKWLREFAVDTNFSANVKITKDYMVQVNDIIHDQYRAFLAYLEQKFRHVPTLYVWIQARLYDTKDYQMVVERALNFYTAQIDSVPEPVFELDMADWHALVLSIVQFNDDNFEAYFNDNYRKSVKMSATPSLYKNFSCIKDIQQQLAKQQDALIWVLNLAGNSPIIKFLASLTECVVEGKGFNKGGEEQRAIFIAFEMVQNLVKMYQVRHLLENYLANLNAYFSQFIANYIRINLPNVLQAKGLTTFSLQLAQLNQALSGRQGENLLKHIRHEYPIALIDESQDINTEQALLIERLYLHDATGRINTHKGFLLLVGDPKQAIYGFRGGDVYNYTTLKNLFPEPPRQLTDNFRSSKALIDSLNQWYDVAETTIANDNPERADELGDNIFYQHIQAKREQALLTNPNILQALPTLYQLRADYKQAFLQPNTPVNENAEVYDEQIDTVNFADIITAQLCLWFDKQTNEPLIFREIGENSVIETPLQLSDICILATKNRYLDQIEKQLIQRGIHTLRGGNQSIFADVMSQDLLKLMASLLQPYHQAKLRALLLSNFFQMTLEEVNAMFWENDKIEANKFLDNLQQLLLKSSEKWHKDSFLTAIQWLFQQNFDEQKQTIWQKLASHEKGERWLIDMRQLLDIINEYLNQQSDKVGEYQLFEWFGEQIQTKPKDEQFLQHRLTSEMGVQLMTIHQSKGLEFPIVFIVGLTDKLRNLQSPYLYLYTNPNQPNQLMSRRLSPLATSEDNNFAQIESKGLYQETLRLLYVALTRAKERVYLVTVAKSQNQSTSPLKPFVKILQKESSKEKQPDLIGFNLHERLDKVCVINTAEQNSLSKKMNFLQQNPNYKLNFDPNYQEKSKIDFSYYQNYLNQIQQKRFYPISHTSFSGLLNFTTHEITQEQDYDNVIDISNNTSSETNETLPIRFNFEKGTVAGTFLHKVLEELSDYQDKRVNGKHFDSNNPVPERWSIIIDKALRRQQMPEKYYSTLLASHYQKSYDVYEPLQTEHVQLANWLNEILHTPLQAPFMQNLRLIDIKPQQKQAEMGFNLRLHHALSLQNLNALFLQYGIELNLQEQYHTQIWQYLKGEIDLVYEHQGCYYILDYKSNFLGSQFTDYEPNQLKKVMDKHHYWLQASIYQVALHRFLSLRLQNYDIYQHLGAVEYAFIRGMSPDFVGVGSLVWQIPVDLVISLDKLLGNKI